MKIEINQKDFLDLVHWARRYADGRLTGVPDSFNRIYSWLEKNYPELMSSEQSDAHVVKNWPYAEEGKHGQQNNHGSF